MTDKTWRDFDMALQDALEFAESSGKPVNFRLHFSPPWEKRHAAELTLFPELTEPVPFVDIRRSARVDSAYELLLVVTSRAKLPVEKLADRGWFRMNPGMRVREFEKDVETAAKASAAVCNVILGLTDLSPDIVFAEGDPSGLLREFLRSALPVPDVDAFDSSQVEDQAAHGSP